MLVEVEVVLLPALLDLLELSLLETSANRGRDLRREGREGRELTGVIVTRRRRRTGAVPAGGAEHLVEGGLDEPSQAGPASSSSSSGSSSSSCRSLSLVCRLGLTLTSYLASGGITSLTKLLTTH